MKKIVSVALSLAIVLSMTTAALADVTFKPGTYTGTGYGHNGKLTVDVTVDETKITDIKVTSHNETAGICEVAIDRIPQSVVDSQSLGVDMVSSATDSSKGLLTAIEDAITQAGGDVEALRAREVVKEDKSSQITYVDTDVCVIGGGISGSVAAIQASDLGAKVILLEKTASTGVRGGAFFAADSHLYDEVGMDPVDEGVFFKEFMEDTSWRADGTLVRDWIEMSKDIVGYLESHGCKFYKTMETYSGGHSYAGGFGCTQYETSERTEIEQIADALKCVVERGGQILCDTTATGLIQDETGAVVGVRASCADGSTLQVNAKSVIIATGGYNADFDWISKSYNGVMPTANFGLKSNLGDGIKMAVEAGATETGEQAVMLRMPRLVGDFNPFNDYESGDGKVKLGKRFQYAVPLLPMTLWVNCNGERICDENEVCYNRNYTGNIVMSQGGYVYVLMSEKMLRTLGEQGAGALNMTQPQGMGFINNYTLLEQGWGDVMMVADGLVDQGVAYKGDTVEALAEAAGMNPQVLAATLSTYNAACAAGNDTSFFKDPAFLTAMDEGPYYLFTENVCVLTSLGGIHVSRYMEAQGMDKEARTYNAIPGLYACGTCTGGLYGDHYANAEGVAQSYCITSGRTAACYAVNNALGTTYTHLTLGE